MSKIYIHDSCLPVSPLPFLATEPLAPSVKVYEMWLQELLFHPKQQRCKRELSKAKWFGYRRHYLHNVH